MVVETFRIPLEPIPQEFALSLRGQRMIFVSRWNESQGWQLDIYTADRVPLVMNIPLVTGADLLGQYRYLGIEGVVLVYTRGNAFIPPTETNLGSESNIFVIFEA